MDGYAPAYVAHNIPLIVVAGLSSQSPVVTGKKALGTRIASEIAPVESDDAVALLRYFRDSDASNLAWNSREHSGRNKFNIKIVGRDFVLPVRTALHNTSATPTSPTPRTVLHSTLSPLSPGSSLYPDGLLNAAWIEKHQNLVPSAYVAFYTFTSDPKTSTLHDNQLKSDINNIKNTISQSGYKTRLVVALLSEKSIVQSPEVEDRLANIRKATGLDSKTSLFFLPPQSSAVELQTFVETVLSTIYPLSIEYYRDLSKHSRRKRNRGIIPPPTAPPTSGTSQTLSSSGWNVRYDFKLGVFAEFRQEMDAALRSYESGYDGLLGSDVLEAIASWSPRWNEARLLADILAIRILRCLLWNGNSTAAVRRWSMHREKLRDFVDRRGKGSVTYGWEAWEARWATVMAEVIKKASLPDFLGPTIYLSPEKGMAMGERMQPWEYLHHPGYWHHTSSKHQIARRALALAIPEEDRSPPGSSPASQIASKAYTYDTYLCPEPHEEYPLPGNKGVDHAALIVQSLDNAILEYEKRGQHRLVQELQLLSGNEYMKIEAWGDAAKTFRSLWQKMSFRKEGWWTGVEEVCWLLRKAAVHAGDAGSILAVDWELMNKSFTLYPNWHYDLSRSLSDIELGEVKPTIILTDKQVHSFLSATYAFEFSEGKVGEPCSSQLSVTSTAHQAASEILISEILVQFDGSMKPIVLKHTPQDQGESESQSPISLQRVQLCEKAEEARPSLVGNSNLTFRPGRTSIFDFSSLFRESGEATAISATFYLSSELFDLEYVHSFGRMNSSDVWWGEKSTKKRLIRDNPCSITVLPKPPKVELHLIGLQDQYYTNEQVLLQLQVTNGEDTDSIIELDVSLLLGGGAAPVALVLIPSSRSSDMEKRVQDADDTPSTPLGKIAAGQSTMVEVVIPPMDLPTVCNISFNANYNLISDLKTPVYRAMSKQLEFINPFEANYDFSPRIHPDPWPSLFTYDESGGHNSTGHVGAPRGIAQKWCLAARYASFATDDLIVEDVDIEVLGVNGGIQCHTRKLTTIPAEGLRVVPRSLEEALFDTFTQKNSLDDRGTATLDVSLAIKWRRNINDAAINTSILAVPRLLISSSEPRVLAAVSYSTNIPSMVHFDVTIENPSNHFLTFGVSMEPSEKFAFSGVKQSTLQLVPLSRRTLRFRLLPNVRGDWIGPMHCVIRDKYFQKVLKIAPTEGMKLDKDGILVWVPPEDDV